MVTDEQVRIIALRDQMRIASGAYSALDQLLQQVHECLVNGSMDTQDAMRFYWTTMGAIEKIRVAPNTDALKPITEKIHDERRALYERWVLKEDTNTIGQD